MDYLETAQRGRPRASLSTRLKRQVRRPGWQVGGWVPLVVVLVFLAVWEGVARLELMSQLFFPPPTRVISTLGELIWSGDLWPHLWSTLRIFVTGFVIGASLGTALGLAMGASAPIRTVVDPLVALVHPLPKIALFPLLLIMLGIGDAPKIAIVAIAAFFPMTINSMAGVNQIGNVYFEVAGSFGMRRRDVITRVIVPGSLPMVFAGARIALNTALVLAIATEILMSNRGLGHLIWLSWETLRTPQLYATLVVIALLGWMIQRGLEVLRRRVIPWGSE